ncbi:hypothetical protein M9Y10_027167 [Tritrichomonas musculus]|uniref:Major facilitator superfamily transporter n=1 Tax=Tritrichomonas musculus TaxID=1915356 RepID=A0ABR2H5U4_9EUKA
MGEDWIPFCKRDKLSFPLLLGIGAATLAGTLLWTVVFALWNPLAAKLQITSAVNTVVLLMGSLIGFLVQPVVGVISDGTTLKWGRRRIYMIVGGLVLVAALLIIMFCESFSKNQSGKQGFLIFGMILVFFAGNILQGPARTLCSDVCPPNQQVLISSIVGIYGGIGGVFTNLIGALSLYQYTSLSQEQFILVVCLCISFAAVVITVIVAHEEQLTEKPATSNPFAALLQALKEINRPFLKVAMAYFFIMIGCYQIGIQLTPFMGADIYGGVNTPNPDDESTIIYQKGVSWAMLCNVVSCAVQFAFGFFQSKLCDLIGLKWVFLVLMTLLGVMYLLFFFVRNRYVYLIMNVPIGLAVVAYNNLPMAVVSLISPAEKLGANLALLNCFNVIGQQISNFGIGMGVAQIWPGKPGHLVGISCIFVFIGAILGFFIEVPDKNAVIDDEDDGIDDSESDDHPASL